ncbi:glycosyltransferase family 29 protein [Stutzerimonas stutzeri]|uniref:glycosyltransferase family 29 protein n=1 Tax=Stutzerimonas stutzeri TaxID=316 RepID=UPI0009C19F1D|nr:glycosyltransferase family 29 protein [Stutzerimonas stutzeri]
MSDDGTKTPPPHKRPLLDRIAEPALELTLGKRDPKLVLSRRIMLWHKQAHAGQLGSIHPEEIEVASASELLILASICVEAGQATKGTSLLELALERDARVLERERYLGLIESAAYTLPFLQEKYGQEIEMARECKRSFGRFAELVRSQREGIAIVGNSPTCVGMGMGEKIDSCSLVIRFNNFSLEPEFRADYGSKTNVWFRTKDYAWLWRKDEIAFDHIVYGGPSFYYRWLNAQDMLVDCRSLGRVPEQVPPEIFKELRRRYGVLAPSTGILAIYWVFFILGSLKDVLLVGFEMTDQPDGETVHYFDQGHKQLKTPHDWRRERDLLDALLLR